VKGGGEEKRERERERRIGRWEGEGHRGDLYWNNLSFESLYQRRPN